MTQSITPFSLKDAPALIERLLPVQKLSAEAYKEQMAGSGKTLTALGSYWKGRKPLILNKACILGCLLPATADPARDLEVFEMLMGMDMASLESRLEAKNDKDSHFILGQHRSVGSNEPYKVWVQSACRVEECGEDLFDHIWDAVNIHLGTNAQSFPELVEQLGIMRFGHRPRVADTFCGSGQIPFEAARLGCDVYASDLNPVACMLTWGAFTIVGGLPESRDTLEQQQQELVGKVQTEINKLGIETDGKGWRAKVFLYCVEARCPQTGWLVPLLPSFVISKPRTGKKIYVIAELKPDPKKRRYNIEIKSGVTEREMLEAGKGTVRSDGRGQDPYMIHTVNGIEYRTKISTLRGDFRNPNGATGNKLRLWERGDFKPRPEDLFQERLYTVQWMRPKKKGKGFDYEFRSVTEDDLKRERIVEEYVGKHLADWQDKGWIPDMRIEPGYNTDQPIRERGWTHWHHLFNSRQLMVAGIARQEINALLAPSFLQSLNWNSRLSHWSPLDGGGGSVKQVFLQSSLKYVFELRVQIYIILDNILCI